MSSSFSAVQDVTNHPLWTGGETVTMDDGQVARFKRKFRSPDKLEGGQQEQEQSKADK